jgi:hypothetical protein
MAFSDKPHGSACQGMARMLARREDLVGELEGLPLFPKWKRDAQARQGPCMDACSKPSKDWVVCYVVQQLAVFCLARVVSLEA